MKSTLKTYSLKDLARAYASKELRVNPEYQRGTKWSLSQQQGLIDSLLRGYQIPLFYVHLMQRPNTFTGGFETSAWLVDGQQRLAAIVSYLQNGFPLPDPQRTTPGTMFPVQIGEIPPWAGKKFEELPSDDKERLIGRELLVTEMIAESANEVRDLFIRLQAGTPLTAQEKRDAWPGDFTTFVIRHAGKPSHPLSNPKAFFQLFPRSRGISVDDGEHYVDGLADARKFFAGLAMTIMLRERADEDFVDLKGKTINEFYKDEANLDLGKDDPGAIRVLRVLDSVTSLRGFESLKEGRSMSFQMAFHLAVLVDSLDEGNYSAAWRENVVSAFIEFQADLARARVHYKETKEALPHYDRFVRMLGGSGSDTADVIRRRHSFLLTELYPKLQIVPLDQTRCFGVLEREVIWNRDRGICQNPNCTRDCRRVPFSEATIHHIVEHTAGGRTILENGILICAECHADRAAMQRLTSTFQDYVRRSADGKATNSSQSLSGPRGGSLDAGERAGDDVPSTARFKIVIDWGALDIDRELQIIAEPYASDSIVKLLVELIGAFGKPIEQQLTELKVIRYPLSRSPSTAFVNPATGAPFTNIRIPGTDLYLCSHSSNNEKVRRLRALFSQLTFPDGRDFPPGSVEVTVDPDAEGV